MPNNAINAAVQSAASLRFCTPVMANVIATKLRTALKRCDFVAELPLVDELRHSTGSRRCQRATTDLHYERHF